MLGDTDSWGAHTACQQVLNMTFQKTPHKPQLTQAKMKPPPSPTRKQIYLVLVQCNFMFHQRFGRRQFCKNALLAMACLSLVVLFMYASVTVISSSASSQSDQLLDIRHFVGGPWKPRVQARHQNLFAQPMSSSPVWDSHQLYESIIHKPKCSSSDILLQILITSAPDHKAQRSTIRETWCSKPMILSYLQTTMQDNLKDLMPVQCTFLVASSDSFEINQSVQTEIQLYEDILYGGYRDVYRNLTLKVLTGLHWTVHDCASKFVLKTDDDCFVNTPILTRLLLEKPPQESTEALYTGNIMDTLEHTKVIRNPDSKWSVSEKEYPPDYYPSYISGTGYLMSWNSAVEIVKQSQYYMPFPVEDAYVGVLAEQAGIVPEHTYRFTLINDKWSMCNYMFLLLIHQIDPDKQRELYSIVEKALVECSSQKFVIKW